MKVTIYTRNGSKYEYKNITNVIERTSGSTGMKWLVLKRQDHKKVDSDDVAERDYVKVALCEVEAIKYN